MTAPHPRLATLALVALLAAGCSAPGQTPAAGGSGSPSARAAAPSTGASTGAAGGDVSPVDAPWVDVAKKVSPSVVAISVQARQGAAAGSGVVLDERHVVTNHHVVAPAAQGGQVLVTLHDERVFATKVVGSDPASDLAVLEVTDPPQDLQPVEMGNSDDLVVGSPVMAVGNPLGLAGTVTTGIVSALDRPVTAGDASGQGGGEPVVTNAIQTSAAVNPGNSGGALVDGQGRLVGINSSIATLGQGSGNIGISFAITQRQMQSVVDQILRSGTVEHAWLGVSVRDAIVEVDGARRWAAAVPQVVSGGPAAKAGLREGDAITAIDGEAVDSALSLIAQVRERPVGTSAKLTVVRGGTEREVSVGLASRPR